MLAKVPPCSQSKRCDELATVAEPGRFYEAHVFVSMGGYFRSSSVEGSLRIVELFRSTRTSSEREIASSLIRGWASRLFQISGLATPGCPETFPPIGTGLLIKMFELIAKRLCVSSCHLAILLPK